MLEKLEGRLFLLLQFVLWIDFGEVGGAQPIGVGPLGLEQIECC
jgi:hypothetical protein